MSAPCPPTQRPFSRVERLIGVAFTKALRREWSEQDAVEALVQVANSDWRAIDSALSRIHRTRSAGAEVTVDRAEHALASARVCVRARGKRRRDDEPSLLDS